MVGCLSQCVLFQRILLLRMISHLIDTLDYVEVCHSKCRPGPCRLSLQVPPVIEHVEEGWVDLCVHC